MSNIRIPEELFYDIARCMLIIGNSEENPIPKELYDRVTDGILSKYDAMKRRKEYAENLKKRGKNNYS